MKTSAQGKRMSRSREESEDETQMPPRKTSRVSRRKARAASAANHRQSKPVQRVLVDHTYIDHMDDVIGPEVAPIPIMQTGGKKTQRGPRGGVTVAFPERLHDMLSAVEKEGLTDIVSWQPHGRCFIVHEKKEFIADVMPRFFHQSKLTSFQRQLNLYGFVRLTAGQDRGAYYHQLFLRGRPALCRRMVRTRVKGNGMKAASNPQNEPDFYAMRVCAPVGTTMESNEEQEESYFTHVSSSSSLEMQDDQTIPEEEPSLPEVTKSNELWKEAALVTPTQTPRQSLNLATFPQTMYLTDFADARLIEPTPSCADDSSQSDASEIQEEEGGSDPHTGDEVFFEGLKFCYLDHLDLETDETPGTPFIEYEIGACVDV